MSPAPDERDRIRAAMDRILDSAPEHSNGALTIVALATEAGVPRNALTQRHTDLKNEFYDKVRARGGTPDSEQRLRKQLRKLKELRAADAEEIARLKADVEGLVGALHQATTENQFLRHELAERTSVVRALPVQLRRPTAPAGPGHRGGAGEWKRSVAAGRVHDHSHAREADQGADDIEAVGAVAVGDHAPGDRPGDEDAAVRGEDPTEVVVALEGRDDTVEPEGDHAGTDPDPAFVLADALPHQPRPADLEQGGDNEQGN